MDLTTITDYCYNFFAKRIIKDVLKKFALIPFIKNNYIDVKSEINPKLIIMDSNSGKQNLYKFYFNFTSLLDEICRISMCNNAKTYRRIFLWQTDQI